MPHPPGMTPCRGAHDRRVTPEGGGHTSRALVDDGRTLNESLILTSYSVTPAARWWTNGGVSRGRQGAGHACGAGPAGTAGHSQPRSPGAPPHRERPSSCRCAQCRCEASPTTRSGGGCAPATTASFSGCSAPKSWRSSMSPIPRVFSLPEWCIGGSSSEPLPPLCSILDHPFPPTSSTVTAGVTCHCPWPAGQP